MNAPTGSIGIFGHVSSSKGTNDTTNFNRAKEEIVGSLEIGALKHMMLLIDCHVHQTDVGKYLPPCP